MISSLKVHLSVSLVPDYVLNRVLKVVYVWIVHFNVTDFFKVHHIRQNLFDLSMLSHALDKLLYKFTRKGYLLLFGVVRQNWLSLFLRFHSAHLIDVIGWSEFSHTLDPCQELVLFLKICSKYFLLKPILHYDHLLVLLFCQQSGVMVVLFSYLIV